MVGLWIQKMEAASILMNVRIRSINAHKINFVSTVKAHTDAWTVTNHALAAREMVQIYATNAPKDSNYAKDSVKVSSLKSDGKMACEKWILINFVRFSDVSNEQRQQKATMFRYLTYLGLCIATCVIFQSSIWIASLIGLAVAIYIMISEYWLTTLPALSSGVQPLEDFLRKD